MTERFVRFSFNLFEPMRKNDANSERKGRCTRDVHSNNDLCDRIYIIYSDVGIGIRDPVLVFAARSCRHFTSAEFST